MKARTTVFGALLLSAAMALSSAAFAVPPASEFLDIHPDLKADPDRPGAAVWKKAGFEAARYPKVKLEPLSIFIAPDSEYKGMNAADIEALAAGFREAVVQTLQPELATVDATGSDVLYVRAALTGVKLKKQERGLLSFTPIGMVVTAVQDAAGKRVSLESAVLEIEAYDGQSGEPVAVIVDRQPGAKSGELSWKSIEDTFRFYAARFKASMLASRGD